MFLIIFYSFLLLGGIVVSQVVALDAVQDILTTLTMIFLAYIMVEVGLEFTIKKHELKSYGWDYLVAATAAAFPWIFCAGYFIFFFKMAWPEALLMGRFAAPTSAGVLFTMLAAAGLGTTWLFKKARILAIFDDLDTILLLVPLQIMFVGLKPQLLVVIVLIGILLTAAYRWLHCLHWPIGKVWTLIYGVVLVFMCQVLEHATHIELEILLPAFVLGCILYNPHDPNHPSRYKHEHMYLEPESGWPFMLDHFIKGGFMFLVGCSLPKIELGNVALGVVCLHVILLTILINVGKCFPSLCYRKEASLKERIALSVAMFPRGEVGAGVLLIAMGNGIKGLPVTLAVLSLALNLLLTGVFISVVMWLIKEKIPKNSESSVHADP